MNPEDLDLSDEQIARMYVAVHAAMDYMSVHAPESGHYGQLVRCVGVLQHGLGIDDRAEPDSYYTQTDGFADVDVNQLLDGGDQQ